MKTIILWIMRLIDRLRLRPQVTPRDIRAARDREQASIIRDEIAKREAIARVEEESQRNRDRLHFLLEKEAAIMGRNRGMDRHP